MQRWAYRQCIGEPPSKTKAQRGAGEEIGMWTGVLAAAVNTQGRHRNNLLVRGDGGRKKCDRLWRRNEITENWTLWADLLWVLRAGVTSPRGWGTSAGPTTCGRALAGHPPTRLATLALNKVSWWLLVKEESVPQVSCLGMNSCCFPEISELFQFHVTGEA